MYKQINPIADLMIEAEQFVLENDRALYVPFFAAAEQFCSERGVLLGGRVGVDLLLGRPITKESFMWDLFCDDTHNTAKALAIAVSRAVSAHVPARTTVLQTNIRHREFTLSVNARLLFKINAIERFRGTSLSAMIATDSRTSYFARVPIKCISAEMQLIEIYHTLYTPAKFARWAIDFANESLLQPMALARVQKTGGTSTGGTDDAGLGPRPSNGDGCTGSRHVENSRLLDDELSIGSVANANHGSNHGLSHGSSGDILPAEFAVGGGALSDELVQQFARGDTACVLVGDHAMHALDFKLPSRPGRPQFIVSADIDSVKAEVARIIRKRSQASRVEYVRYQLGLTTDFQITKHTLYEVTARDKIPLMDVFNSAQFEMIPFIPHTVGSPAHTAKIGNPWVILRFLHIDMWILNFIASGARNPAIERRIAEIKKQVIQVRERYISGVGTGAHPESSRHSNMDMLFPTANFVGVYLDENVVKKQMIRGLGENFPPYYPARESPTVGGADYAEKSPIANGVIPHYRVGSNDNSAPIAREPPHMVAGAVNIGIDVPRKKLILKKVFGRVDHTIRQTLERHHGTAVNSTSGEKPSVWGVGKDVSKFALRHKFFLQYIPARVNTLVDFGCGSGLDLLGMKSITEVSRAICADVIDERDASARESPFVLVAPGSILPFANETIDMYMIFHVLHHMNIDLVGPIKDIVRTLIPGGLVLLKDHDVSTTVQASNVDFEHLAYAVSADTGNLDQMMRNYGTIEPMTYYTAKEVIKLFESAGCVLLKSEIITPRTYIYGAIFQKRAHTQ